MEIRFAKSKLHSLCNDERKLRGAFGVACARRIQRRLAELQAAESLEDLRNLPQARCHELTADRKGQLAVDVEHPMRLIFEPDHQPVPTKPDGGLDWSRVTQIRVLEITDYH